MKKKQTSKGVGVPLAIEPMTNTARGTAIKFLGNHTAECRQPDKAQRLCPWGLAAARVSPVNGAKSYTIIAENSDAKPITPFCIGWWGPFRLR
jgi:hypothetical protein